MRVHPAGVNSRAGNGGRRSPQSAWWSGGSPRDPEELKSVGSHGTVCNCRVVSRHPTHIVNPVAIDPVAKLRMDGIDLCRGGSRPPQVALLRMRGAGDFPELSLVRRQGDAGAVAMAGHWLSLNSQGLDS